MFINIVMKKLILFVLSLLLISCHQHPKQPKYIFYFIGDGMGINQVLATEMFLAAKKGVVGIDTLSFSNFPTATFSATYSRYNAVTCSAAAGTALASGFKTKKGAIGVDSLLQNPLYSVAYYAKKIDKKVGIVTSVSIDHATPAAFYAHQPNRSMGYEIAIDLLCTNFDFFAGSGFSQLSKDDRPNIISLLKDSGYCVAYGYEQFLEYKKDANKIVLLQQDSLLRLPYAIDRKRTDLSLQQMTTAAVDYLGNHKNGFFVMVEGGLIDWACHSNDASTTITEIEDFSKCVDVALDFYKKYPDETLIVLTADHETGGIVLGTGEYCLDLALLQYQKCSVNELTRKISECRDSLTWDTLKSLLGENLGFWEKYSLTTEEEYQLFALYNKTIAEHQHSTIQNLYSENEAIAQAAVEILNKKAKIGWTSYGHSAGVVPVYAIGCGSESFMKVRDNVDIPRIMLQLLK